MIDHIIRRMENPLDNITVNLGVDAPLWTYVKKAVREIEVINVLGLNRLDEYSTVPFVHVDNWNWNPYPAAAEIQHRRRETGNKLMTKTIGNSRLGILEFDIFYGGRDKNKMLETAVSHNKIYIPIEDDHGRYLLDNVLYSEYQLVDKLLYPSGKDSITLKSLLPIVIKYEEANETSIDGYIYYSKIGMVKIFTTMEPILSCFMHIPSPLSYLGVFPIIRFTDHVGDDGEQYHYFQPIPDRAIYIKGYKKGLEQFDYVRSILVMCCHLIRKHQPETLDELNDPKWWVYQLSYYENTIEHRGACHEMHVARMLDTISAQVLPIPEVDKTNMVSLLRYVLQTEFTDINIYSYENKRLRLNEVISTIVTADVSDKLKKLFRFGQLVKCKEMEPVMKFHPDIILKNMYKLGTVHTVDFANDLDYYQLLRMTKKGPNSLGRMDKHKVNFGHKQLHPSMIGRIDMLESSKDVGQSGMISPWADVSTFFEMDTNKYPNIKYDLFDFIKHEFPLPAITFNCDNIVDYNKILDKLVKSAYINLDYHIQQTSDDGEET